MFPCQTRALDVDHLICLDNFILLAPVSLGKQSHLQYIAGHELNCINQYGWSRLK